MRFQAFKNLNIYLNFSYIFKTRIEKYFSKALIFDLVNKYDTFVSDLPEKKSEIVISIVLKSNTFFVIFFYDAEKVYFI